MNEQIRDYIYVPIIRNKNPRAEDLQLTQKYIYKQFKPDNFEYTDSIKREILIDEKYTTDLSAGFKLNSASELRLRQEFRKGILFTGWISDVYLNKDGDVDRVCISAPTIMSENDALSGTVIDSHIWILAEQFVAISCDLVLGTLGTFGISVGEYKSKYNGNKYGAKSCVLLGAQLPICKSIRGTKQIGNSLDFKNMKCVIAKKEMVGKAQCVTKKDIEKFNAELEDFKKYQLPVLDSKFRGIKYERVRVAF